MQHIKLLLTPSFTALISSPPQKLLTRRFFEHIIDAREDDLEVSQRSSVEDVEEYGDKTFSSLLKLCLEAADVRSDGPDHVAAHLGRAMAIATAIRSAEALARTKGEIAIPQSLMRSFEVPSKTLLEPMAVPIEKTSNDNQKLSEAVFEFATSGNSHLEHARDYFKTIDAGLQKQSHGIFLRCLQTSQLYEVFEETNFDVFDPRLGATKRGIDSLPVQMLKAKFMSSSPF
jgi:NADH dehydrogenase [ubiquinone] 1 alpha subcomplex assembly factor 6